MSVLDKKCWYLLFGVSGGVSAGQLITDRGGMLEDSRGDKGAGGHVLWGGKGCAGWGAGRPLQNPGSHLRPQLAAANETLGLEMRNLGMVRFWGCLMAGCCGLGGSRMSGARRAGGDLQLWGAGASPPPPAAGAECCQGFAALTLRLCTDQSLGGISHLGLPGPCVPPARGAGGFGGSAGSWRLLAKSSRAFRSVGASANRPSSPGSAGTNLLLIRLESPPVSSGAGWIFGY